MKISKTFRFEASHQILTHPGKCRRLHGHSWVLTVFIEGDVHFDTGMVMDYGTIKDLIDPLINRLDHHHLGYGRVEIEGESEFLLSDVEGLPKRFLPTSENLLWWIARHIPIKVPWCTLELNETCTSAASLTKDEFLRKGGRPNGKERHEEGREEREEVPAEEEKEVASGGDKVEESARITDDDLPF